ncbi:MAG: hypothetical protein V4580_19925 [Bacteroidota bacterium]
MRICILSILVALLTCVSCHSEKPQAEATAVTSTDLTHTASCGDTINQTIDGLKQGVWVTQSSPDTTVYLNDTAYAVNAPMTSGEMLRELKTGARGPVIDFDSLVLNSH